MIISGFAFPPERLPSPNENMLDYLRSVLSNGLFANHE